MQLKLALRYLLIWSFCGWLLGGLSYGWSTSQAEVRPRPPGRAAGGPCVWSGPERRSYDGEAHRADVVERSVEGAVDEPVRLLTPLECALLLQEDDLRRQDVLFRAGDASEGLQWAPEVDIETERAAYELSLRESFASCGADIEVVAVDCSEPPCIALAEGPFDARECGARLHGESFQAAQELLCPDGSRQSLSLVAPAEVAPELLEDPALAGRSLAGRYLSRFAKMRDEVRCIEW